jgi:type IV pilus assembly protein PilB
MATATIADTPGMEPARPLQLTVNRAETRAHLGTLLIRDGLLTAEQLEAALADKEDTGRRLGEIVVDRGWVTPAALAKALAEQHHLEFLDLGQCELEPEATDLLPEKFARRYQALPVKFVGEDQVLVAVSDPTNVLTSDDLRLALGLNVRLAVVAGPDLATTINRVYRTTVDLDDEQTVEPAEEDPIDDIREAAATTAPAIKLVNSLIAQAIDDGASDLHFEPQNGQMVVRVRIDGVMRKVATIPRAMQPAVTSRLKIMGELDIAERRAPQDGRVSIRFGGEPIDLRIAVLPTTYGEQAVLRILHRAGFKQTLADLGMSPEAEASFLRAIRQPYGAVIAVGPTGSGKTTTLYAALDVLNDEGRVLTTIEDPVEYQVPGVNQIEVRPKSGLTFANGLRTILRSDPDVLLVGEIRDEETARIAIQAAMTGHTVLTTLHTHNAASSIARLVDMRVEPSLLAASINCIIAQRLARRLCLECRESYWPADEELADLGMEGHKGEFWLHKPVGCAHCAGTGYAGRVALYEVLLVEGRMRALIENGSTDEIFVEATKQGMTTMRQDGARLCVAGITSLDELRRVTGERLA